MDELDELDGAASMGRRPPPAPIMIPDAGLYQRGVLVDHGAATTSAPQSPTSGHPPSRPSIEHQKPVSHVTIASPEHSGDSSNDVFVSNFY